MADYFLSNKFFTDNTMSITSTCIAALARFAGVSRAFEQKIKTGKDSVASRCPKPSSADITCKEKTLQRHTVYYFENQNNDAKKCVLYFHGGAYLTNFSTFHWRFLQDMVKQTGCSVVTPDYPLAPDYFYKDVFAMIVPLYKECVERYGSENVILMGDSAGGGLALALAQLSQREKLAPPEQVILLSPWLDATCSNNAMDEIEKHDPMLRKSSLMQAAKIYSRGDDLGQPLLSPLFENLHNIGNISVFTGTHDILNADAHQLQKKAESEGVRIRFEEAENMIHIWMVIGISREAKAARKKIYALVNPDAFGCRSNRPRKNLCGGG